MHNSIENGFKLFLIAVKEIFKNPQRTSLKQTSRYKFQSFKKNSCKFKETLQNLTVKLKGIAEVGMRQKAWWSVKMYWALSQRVWTAARLATAVSPDNSGYQEPARTCGEVLESATSLLTAADWPLGQSRAAGCSHIHHLHTCTTLLHAHWGRHYFFHFTPWYFSCQIKKWHEK